MGNCDKFERVIFTSSFQRATLCKSQHANARGCRLRTNFTHYLTVAGSDLPRLTAACALCDFPGQQNTTVPSSCRRVVGGVAEHFSLGMAIIFVSGALNGSFALPMKYARRWGWENTWLVFALIAFVVLPWLLAAGFVPHLGEVYRQSSGRPLTTAAVFGFMWGIAQCTFGLGIETVGMALAFAVVSGLACLSGSLVPQLVMDAGELLRPRGLLLLASIPILLSALVFYGKAGRRREREQRGGSSTQSRTSYSFTAGLVICVFTGIVGSAWNVGFAFSGPILHASAVAGAGPLTSTYAVWAVILSAGFVPNLIYCVYLLSRNKTWSRFGGALLYDAMLGVAMAFLWL